MKNAKHVVMRKKCIHDALLLELCAFLTQQIKAALCSPDLHAFLSCGGRIYEQTLKQSEVGCTRLPNTVFIQPYDEHLNAALVSQPKDLVQQNGGTAVYLIMDK